MTTRKITVEGREYSDARACIIAEVAQAHDGSLGTAHAYIDAIADSGADAVKFQTHIAAEESTVREAWRVKFSRQDRTRFEYWRRMEFSEEQWRGLRQHALDRGLIFLSSAFSPAAVELLQRIGQRVWKVASGEVGNVPLLEQMIRTGDPILISSGMSELAELDQAVERCRSAGVSFGVMQCTTAYPCPPEKVGINLIGDLRSRFEAPVGLSDHSGTVFPALAAVTLGVAFIEVHVTFHRKMFGPDVPASLTFEEMKELVRGARFIETMRASPVDKDGAARETAGLRRIFGKSLVARRDLGVGHLISACDVACKKPGDGIPPSRLHDVIGRRLRHHVATDETIKWENLE